MGNSHGLPHEERDDTETNSRSITGIRGMSSNQKVTDILKYEVEGKAMIKSHCSFNCIDLQSLIR